MSTPGASPRKLYINRSVFLALVGLLLLVTVIRVWGPVARARRQEAENARLRAQKVAAEAEHARLEAQKRRLASDKGAEGVVRQEGYVKDGERRLVFVPGKSEEAKGRNNAAKDAP